MNDVNKIDENKEDRGVVDEKKKNGNNVKNNDKTTKSESITKEEDGKCQKSESEKQKSVENEVDILKRNILNMFFHNAYIISLKPLSK